jgi:hypothetical protein
VVPAVTRRVALAQLCPGAFHPAAGATLAALVDQEYVGIGRPATDQERALWVKHLSDGASDGCAPGKQHPCDLQKLADQLCTSLFATAQFNYY